MNLLKFDAYEVHAVKELGDTAQVSTDQDADYFCLYGLVKNDTGYDFYMAIGDYDCRQDAEIVRDILQQQKRGLSPYQ